MSGIAPAILLVAAQSRRTKSMGAGEHIVKTIGLEYCLNATHTVHAKKCNSLIVKDILL